MEQEMVSALRKHKLWVDSFGKTGTKLIAECYAAELYSSAFVETYITSGIFVKTELAYAQFRDTKIELANFSKGDLSNSAFINTEISNSKFVNCLLDNVLFEHVYLRNVDFTGALLNNVLIDQCSTIESVSGLEDAHIQSINIGTIKEPNIIRGQEALSWLKCRGAIKLKQEAF